MGDARWVAGLVLKGAAMFIGAAIVLAFWPVFLVAALVFLVIHLIAGAR